MRLNGLDEPNAFTLPVGLRNELVPKELRPRLLVLPRPPMVDVVGKPSEPVPSDDDVLDLVPDELRVAWAHAAG